MSLRLLSPVAGRTAPAAPESLLIASASGRRPPELDDATWLRARLLTDGHRAIALQLGVSRKAVSLACARLGISASPPGRRRGASSAGPVTSAKAPDPHQTTTEATLLGRYRRESRPGGPAPTEDLLVGRIRAAHEARAAGDDPAYDDALLAIASAAVLIHEHRRKLRAAA